MDTKGVSLVETTGAGRWTRAPLGKGAYESGRSPRRKPATPLDYHKGTASGPPGTLLTDYCTMPRRSTKPFKEVLRNAVREAGRSNYAVAKGAGVAPIVLQRFINGDRGLNLETAERIARFLGLELRPTLSD